MTCEQSLETNGADVFLGDVKRIDGYVASIILPIYMLLHSSANAVRLTKKKLWSNRFCFCMLNGWHTALHRYMHFTESAPLPESLMNSLYTMARWDKQDRFRKQLNLIHHVGLLDNEILPDI
jgi:uncharacterized protein YjiS (DUF1127 family)